jgi:uncharacterized membrane protein
MNSMNVDRTISALIIIIIIIGIIGVFYISLHPIEAGNYTEFYLLGENGKASNYPTNLTIGQTGNLTIGVVNHENSPSNYQIKILQDNQILKMENITLKNNEKIELPFEFTAKTLGQHKIVFNLYKLPDVNNTYRSLFLQVNVNN